MKVVPTELLDGARSCTSTSKYTSSCTTLSTAVWLFRAISRGLDNTRVSPNSRNKRTVRSIKRPVVVGVGETEYER